ncbi:TPA: hypothetical protein ACHGFI_003946 [Escherichia coli]
MNTVLQIVAGVNLLQRRYQVVSFIVLLIIFVTTHWLHPVNAMIQLYYGSYLVFFIILSVIVFRQVIFSARVNTESICAEWFSAYWLYGIFHIFCDRKPYARRIPWAVK